MCYTVLIEYKKNLATTYSSALLSAVPSAIKNLTSEFGMGSGVSFSLKSPRKNTLEFDVTSQFQKAMLKNLHATCWSFIH